MSSSSSPPSSSSSSSFSYQQELTLALTPKCTASLSILCNLFILYECWCDRYGPHQKNNNAIRRAVLGMTCIDIMASLGWGLSSWAVPKGTFALAAGNIATCNFQGFLLQFAIGAPLYNCSLAMYYLLVIKYNWSNEMLYRIEQWTHVAILTFSIGAGITSLLLKQYNPIGNVCSVIGYPADCGHSSFGPPSDVPCERGDYAFVYGMALFYGPLWVCVIACILSMIMIYLEVRATHQRMERYGLNPREPRVHSLRRSQTDTSSVATQAILYTLSFFVTWTPSTIWSVAHYVRANSFWLNFASALCEPLQGFWNCIVFLRQRPASRKKIRIMVHAIFPCCCKDILHEGSLSAVNSGNGNTDHGERRSSVSKYSSQHERRPGEVGHDGCMNVGVRRDVESSSRESFTNRGSSVDGFEGDRSDRRVLFEQESDHNDKKNILGYSSDKTGGDDDIVTTIRGTTNGLHTVEDAGQPFSPNPPLSLIDEERQQYKYYYPSADFDLRFGGGGDSSAYLQEEQDVDVLHHHKKQEPTESHPLSQLLFPSESAAIESLHEEQIPRNTVDVSFSAEEDASTSTASSFSL